MSKTRIMTSCAVLIAIGTILSNIKLYEFPNGGAITAGGMLPFMIISFRYGLKWGVLSAFVNSLLQMALGGIYPPPAGTFISLVAMILLDYILAYTSLGVACIFTKPFKREFWGMIFAIIISCFLRFMCSFLSGIILWGDYAPKDIPLWLYSFGYNISYMLPDTIICVVLAVILYKTVPKVITKQN